MGTYSSIHRQQKRCVPSCATLSGKGTLALALSSDTRVNVELIRHSHPLGPAMSARPLPSFSPSRLTQTDPLAIPVQMPLEVVLTTSQKLVALWTCIPGLIMDCFDMLPKVRFRVGGVRTTDMWTLMPSAKTGPVSWNSKHQAAKKQPEQERLTSFHSLDADPADSTNSNFDSTWHYRTKARRLHRRRQRKPKQDC